MFSDCGFGEDLRIPWTAWRSNQSILKEIKSEYSLDWCWSWSSNPLATWYKEPTHLKRPWCWERLRERGEELRERGEERGKKDKVVGWHHWLSGHEFAQTLGDREEQGSLACCNPWSHKESQTQLSDWTTAMWQELFYVLHVNAFTPHNSFSWLGALMILFL